MIRLLSESDVGETFHGLCRVVETLDWGSTLRLHRAQHPELGEFVLALLPVDAPADDAERFAARADALQALTEPGVVRVMGHGIHRGVFYLELEWSEGAITLEEALRAGAFERERALAIAGELLETLGAAHSRGMHHGRLTPASVLLVPGAEGRERAKLVELGADALFGRETDWPEPSAELRASPYLAPEVRRGGASRASAAADVFSAAALLHRMLTGGSPGESGRPDDDVDASLALALAKGMAERPEDRPRDASEFRRLLESAQPGPARVDEPEVPQLLGLWSVSEPEAPPEPEPEPPLQAEAPLEPEPEPPVQAQAPLEPEPPAQAEAPPEPEPPVQAEAPLEPEPEPPAQAEAPLQPEPEPEPEPPVQAEAPLELDSLFEASLGPPTLEPTDAPAPTLFSALELGDSPATSLLGPSPDSSSERSPDRGRGAFSLDVSREELGLLDAVTKTRVRPSLAPPVPRGPALEGSLDAMHVTALLQSMEMGRKDGTLRLEWAHRVVHVVLQRGAIVGDFHRVVAQLGAVLCWPTGRFLLIEGLGSDGASEQTLPVSHVLFEAMRQHDERIRMLQGLPAPATVLVLRAGPRDLTGLERDLARACDGQNTLVECLAKVAGDPAESIATMRDLWERGILVEHEAPAEAELSIDEPEGFRTSTVGAPAPDLEPLGAPRSPPARADEAPQTPPAPSPAPTWWQSLLAAVGLRKRTGTLTPSVVSPSSAEVPPAAATDSSEEVLAPRSSPGLVSAGVALPSWREREPCDAEPLLVARHLSGLMAADSKLCADESERRFFEQLVSKCVGGELDLPIFPDSAQRLDVMLRHGDPDLEEVIDVVEADPMLMRRVLQRASAAAYARVMTDLRQAIVRIGLDVLWQVAMSAILNAPVFRVRGLEEEAKIVRSVSVLTGSLALELCSEPSQRGEHFLAGLLHDVGSLQIMRVAAARGVRPPAGAVATAIARYGSGVGVLIARAWGMPLLVQRSVGAHPRAETSIDVAVRRAQITAQSLLGPEVMDEDALVIALESVPGPPMDARKLRRRAEKLAVEVKL